jgi:hypothetical protein
VRWASVAPVPLFRVFPLAFADAFSNIETGAHVKHFRIRDAFGGFPARIAFTI